jgi:hypothetical protein
LPIAVAAYLHYWERQIPTMSYEEIVELRDNASYGILRRFESLGWLACLPAGAVILAVALGCRLS